MLTLYSYPGLFGVADNNGYGLKVFAFLKLAGLPFTHRHVFDASAAPRGQLPYIVDDGEAIGDSDTIIAHLIGKYHLALDGALTAAQRDMSHLIERMLDDLYWVMSYSRWKDERYRPAFLQAFRREHPGLTEEDLRKAQEFNAQRYHYQGIGRYSPAAAYARGVADLQVLGISFRQPASPWSAARQHRCGHSRFPGQHLLLRDRYDDDQFVAAHRNLVRHCSEIHASVA
jgi:glutathione S-transferase